MALTVWPAAGDDSPTLVARAYGAGLSDLAVDFDRPLDAIMSAVLQACLSGDDGAAFSGAEVAGWTLLKRRQGLLAVATATHGPARNMTVTCGTCAEKLDLSVDLTSFRQDWRIEDIPFGDKRLRLPRPADLADIQDGNELRLAERLLVGEPSSEDWVTEAEAAFSAADSLTDLELQADCPECGKQVVYPLILETYLIDELSREASRLMDEIHVMALAYHWTEPDILLLPESRRRHYLARIQEAFVE